MRVAGGADVTAALAFAVLLAIVGLDVRYRECVERTRATIVREADDAARAHGVPVALLIVVGWVESHCGCDPRAGGSWGAPVSALRRRVAGRAMHAASALAAGHRACGSWEGAVARFRSGSCVTVVHHAYVARVLRAWTHVEGTVVLTDDGAASGRVGYEER